MAIESPQQGPHLRPTLGESAGSLLPTRSLLVLLLVLLLAAGLRLGGLSYLSLRGDEAFSVVFARQDLGEVWRGLLLTEPHPPLYYSALHYWMAAAGQSELAVRYFSAFFGILVVAVTYRLARSLGSGEEVGLAATFLVAVNPYLVWQSRDARMYTLLAATCAASLLLALLIWRELLARGNASPWLWLGYLVVSLSSLYAHYGAIFAIAAQNLALLVWLYLRATRQARLWSWPLLLKWLLAQAALLAGFLPWMLAAAPLMLGHTKNWIPSISLTELLERAITTYGIGTTAGDFTAPLAAAFAVVLAAGAWRGLRTNNAGTAAMLAYLLVPLLAAFLVSLARPMFDERYFLFVIPALCLTLARIATVPSRGGVSGTGGRGASVILGLVTVALVGAVSLYSIGNSLTQPQYAKSPGWRELVQYVLSSAAPGDLVVQNYPDPTLSYYLDSRLPLRVIPGGAPLQQAATDRQLAQATGEARRIWFLPYESADWDANGYVEQWLRRNTAFASAASPGGLDLELYLVRTP